MKDEHYCSAAGLKAANWTEWSISEDACPNCTRLEAQLAEVLGRLHALEAELTQDSRTSSQPPSQDNPWTPKSERQKTARSSGAQRGHVGKTLKMAEHADEVLSLPLTGYCACGQAWDSADVHDQVAQRVHDFLARTDPQQGPCRLPELCLQVTEYCTDGI